MTEEKDDLGPQFDAVHPFAPCYITYTPGLLVHASKIMDPDTRPSTVGGYRQERKNFGRTSKTSSLGSKGSHSREKRDAVDQKRTSSSEKQEMSSKERLARNVIKKINAESDKNIDWRQNGDIRKVVVDVLREQETESPKEDIPRVEIDAGSQDTNIFSQSESVDTAYDFDVQEELEIQSDVVRTKPLTPNRISSTKFKAIKIVSKGTFKSNKDFLVEDLSISTP